MSSRSEGLEDDIFNHDVKFIDDCLNARPRNVLARQGRTNQRSKITGEIAHRAKIVSGCHTTCKASQKRNDSS